LSAAIAAIIETHPRICPHPIPNCQTLSALLTRVAREYLSLMIITYPKSVLILYLRIQENLENICRIFDTGRRMISAEDAILELMQSEELVVTYKRSASATGAALSNALQTQSV
jgi:hypothetical protein